MTLMKSNMHSPRNP